LLVVSDGFTQSAPSAVTIRAGETSSLPGCAPAARPVAKAGADFTATSRYVNLSGAGSTSSRSAPLTYRWTLVTAPSGAGWMGSATTVNPTLYTEGSGSYVATLVVNDGCQDSLPDSVTITVPNHAPTASAYSPPIVPTRTSVTLDSSSYDQDGDPLTYAWKLESAPAGSVAALSRADVQRPTFVPDVDGSYVFSLVVRDSELASTPAALTITASNMKPVAKAGADQALPVGATVTLDASSSTDANGTPLTFAWTLARKPAGSAAAISTPDAAAATLVPDVEGVYVARLVASDGVQSASDDVTIAVWPAMQRLAHRVIDAEYSAALDRIIAVAADPNALRVIDPRTHAETTIALSMPPAAVSVSPDGLRAAVGHTNWISIVDLQTRAVETVAVIADVADLALAGNGWAYAVPRSPGTSEKARVVAVRLDTGVQTYATSNQTGIVRIKVRPGDSALYVAAASYSTVERFDITAGVPVLGGSVSAGYSYGGCGDLWLSEAGARIFTRCGSVYRASSAWSEDLSFAGSLRAGASGSASLLARHLSDSTEANEISAITRSDSTDYSYEDDEVLQRYEAASLGLLETAPFPSELVNGAPFPWRGRYVFYRSDGSERYVILQLDPASGALLDFGVATF
jgi:chitinase